MTSTLRRAIVPGIAALLAVSVSACGSSSDNAADNSGSGGSSSSAGGSGSLSGTLNGGGSSAQTAAQATWMSAFQQANNDKVTVNYDPVGSGDGVTGFLSKKYSFAGSDAALSTDSSDNQVTAASKTCGGDAIEVPAYVSAIAIVFHLDGVDKLDLSPATVADIFSGKITTWNDPEIQADNPDATLPSTKITPVHRSDSSGTTNNFTDYLSQTSDGAWSKPASSDWPYTTGASGNGTSGLVDAVKGGNGTIGYADLSQSTGLSVADLKVGSDYVTPSAATAAQALTDSKVETGRPDGDLAIDIDRTDTNTSAYPLILTSYLIACPSYSDASTAALVKGYLTYAVSSDGQNAAAAAAGSAPLPSDLATQATAAIAMIGS